MPTLESIFLRRPTTRIPEPGWDQAIADEASEPKAPIVSPSGKAAIRIFISHSSADVEVARPLVELLRSALTLRASEIRCTSVDGYRLEGGANTEESLRREVRDSELFIGIISQHSLGSLYVVFELGARWGTERPLIPLLAPGTPSRVLGGPLSNINALRLDSEAQVHQLVDEIAQKLNLKAESPAVYSAHLGAFKRTDVPDVDRGQTIDPTTAQPNMTAEADSLLQRIGKKYVVAGNPNRAAWTITPRAEQEALFAELRTHGLIEPGGLGNHEWRLTLEGLTRILATSMSRPSYLDLVGAYPEEIEGTPDTPGAAGDADMRGKLLVVLQKRARLDPAGTVSATFQEIAVEIGSKPGIAHEILLGLRDEGHLELQYVEGSGADGVFQARIPIRHS